MGWRDLANELDARPGCREAYEEQFPYANVALAVVDLRARHDLTQRALAERVGTPQPVIARLESGRHPVEIKLLSRIATAVGESWTITFGPQADELGMSGTKINPRDGRRSREAVPNRR